MPFLRNAFSKKRYWLLDIHAKLFKLKWTHKSLTTASGFIRFVEERITESRAILYPQLEAITEATP